MPPQCWYGMVITSGPTMPHCLRQPAVTENRRDAILAFGLQFWHIVLVVFTVIQGFLSHLYTAYNHTIMSCIITQLEQQRLLCILTVYGM